MQNNLFETENGQKPPRPGVPLDAIVMPILSLWVVEKGRWDEAINNYVDRKSTEFERTISMRIEMWNGKKVLVFDGGPTGHESYYIDDLLLSGKRGDKFCICGGTINSWPACYVSSAEVFDFIKA